jgi:hypothetical protein
MKLVLFLELFLGFPLFFLNAWVPFWIGRCIVALLRRQWRASLFAVGGIAVPFGWIALVPYLEERALIPPQMAIAVINCSAFGLLIGVISFPFLFRKERRGSARRRQSDR